MNSILRTRRLDLRELQVSDLDFVARMLGDPEVMRHYPKVLDRDESSVWLERQLARYAQDGHGLWLVELRDTGERIGQVGLIRQIVEGVPEREIGWLLHRPFWGNGYATEAAAATRELAFTTWDLPYVISLIRPVNLPSQAVARRIGMTPTRHVLFHGFEHVVWRVERGGLPARNPELERG